MSAKRKSGYFQKYRIVWENDDRFKEWLQSVPGDITKARCRVCGTYLQAHMRSLLGHYEGKRHIENMNAIFSPQQALITDTVQKLKPNLKLVSSVNDSEFDSSSETIFTTSAKRKSGYFQKYRIVWENDDRFKEWLQSVPGDNTKARCRVCGTFLQAHMKSLLGHYEGKRHIENMNTIFSPQQALITDTVQKLKPNLKLVSSVNDDVASPVDMKSDSITQRIDNTPKIIEQPSASNCPSDAPLGARKRGRQESFDIFSLIGERLQLSREDDEFDTAGKNIGNKLRKLSREQQLFAERVINEVLFEGELGNLTKFSKLLVSPDFVITVPGGSNL